MRRLTIVQCKIQETYYAEGMKSFLTYDKINLILNIIQVVGRNSACSWVAKRAHVIVNRNKNQRNYISLENSFSVYTYEQAP